MRFLIDECLHPSLVNIALARGYEAYYVGYVGMASTQDWDLMIPIVEGAYTFVTNNARDFRRLYEGEPIHAGLIIIVPQVPPKQQRIIFDAVLDRIGEGELLNQVLEAVLENGEAVLDVYEWPEP